VASVSISEALTRLADLITEAAKHTVVIVSGERAVRLTPVRVPRHRARHFGSAAGRVHIGADFDKPLDEFAEYS
jgi:antitoxin (DNA-binding transcriptional repressor) of toxin-antitoxin stability system